MDDKIEFKKIRFKFIKNLDYKIKWGLGFMFVVKLIPFLFALFIVDLNAFLSDFSLVFSYIQMFSPFFMLFDNDFFCPGLTYVRLNGSMFLSPSYYCKTGIFLTFIVSAIVLFCVGWVIGCVIERFRKR